MANVRVGSWGLSFGCDLRPTYKLETNMRGERHECLNAVYSSCGLAAGVAASDKNGGMVYRSNGTSDLPEL